MTLSDIKFQYSDKIENIDNRINRYNQIVDDYNQRINIAEKEEAPNISSVLEAKYDYEKKIKNLIRVKEYYQEFVDTSDYLLQNLNNEESFLLISKNEELQDRCDLLTKEIGKLENKIADAEELLNHQKILYGLEKNKVSTVRNNYKNKISTLKEKHSLKIKQLQYDIKKLKKENGELRGNYKSFFDISEDKNNRLRERCDNLENQNKHLKNRCGQLENYCNELLNREGIFTGNLDNIFYGELL